MATAPTSSVLHTVAARLEYMEHIVEASHGSAGVRFGRLAPTIPVTDIVRSVAFYRDRLGMSVVFENGDPVGFAILTRDDAELHLCLVRGHRAGVHNAAHLMVTDAAALHEDLCRHGVRIVKGLRDAPYGLRGFVFSDPDNNRVDVGEEI